MQPDISKEDCRWWSISEEAEAALSKIITEHINIDILISIYVEAGHVKYTIPSTVDMNEVSEWVKINALNEYIEYPTHYCIMFSNRRDYEWTILRWG